MRHESIQTNNLNGHDFSNTPGTTGDTWSFQSGVWVPRSIANIRSDLGIGQHTQQIVYGSLTPGTTLTENVTIPAWAVSYRLRLHGAGGGGMSGARASVATTAINGGASGAGGYYLDIEGQADELRGMGGSVLVLSMGAVGAGGAGRTVDGAGTAGTAGGDTTAAVNSIVFAAARGGARTTSFSTAATNNVVSGGHPGGSGVTGGNGAGTAATIPITTPSAAGGGAGAGIAASGPFLSGGAGGLGGSFLRNATESAAAGGSSAGGNGTSAVNILVKGLPVPGNGGGGGASQPSGNGGNGGNGANGGGGGGGGAARNGTTGAGGNGGRSWAIVEFFGSDAHRIEVTAVPISFGGRLTCISGDPVGSGVGATLFYEPFIHGSYPSIDGSTDTVVLRELPVTSLSLSFTGQPANCYDIFLRYNRTTQQSELSRIAWTNSTTRGYTPARVKGIPVFATNTATNKELTLIGTVYWNGTELRNQDKFRWICNLYNPITTRLQVLESTSFWNPTAIGVWERWGDRSGNPTGGLNNRTEVVNCLNSSVTINFTSRMAAGSGGFAGIGVSLNSNFSAFNAFTTSTSDQPYTITIIESLALGLNLIQPHQMGITTNPTFLSNSACGTVTQCLL